MPPEEPETLCQWKGPHLKISRPRGVNSFELGIDMRWKIGHCTWRNIQKPHPLRRQLCGRKTLIRTNVLSVIIPIPEDEAAWKRVWTLVASWQNQCKREQKWPGRNSPHLRKKAWRRQRWWRCLNGWDSEFVNDLLAWFRDLDWCVQGGSLCLRPSTGMRSTSSAKLA